MKNTILSPMNFLSHELLYLKITGFLAAISVFLQINANDPSALFISKTAGILSILLSLIKLIDWSWKKYKQWKSSSSNNEKEEDV
jgi:hypothetical protein